METDTLALRTRLSLAVATVVGVAAAELGTFFCTNARLAITGMVTALLVLLPLAKIATAWMGARGGFLVGVTSLGCIPTAACFARWEARGLRSSPTSDFEDFALLVLLVGGFAAAATFAIRRSRTAFTKETRVAIGRSFAGALLMSVALLAWALLRAVRGSLESWPDPTTVIVAAGVGVALAIALGVAARGARARHEALAAGMPGVHRGDGWIELDDGAARVHRSELAGQREGSVVVLGWTKSPDQGYRGAQGSASDLTITFGTPEEIRDAGSTRAASLHAVGIAALAFSALPLVAATL